MNEKSILEQALLQVQTLEEAVKTNAKGILASTMKQELNDLLKESLEEEDDVYEQAPKKGKKDVPDEGDEDLDAICSAYACNKTVGREYLSLLSSKQISAIKKQQEIGGTKK